MALHFSHLITLLFVLLNYLSPVSCLNPVGPLNSGKVGLYSEGKGRLGSKPPSCYDKCNQCHPCIAVQVPTLLSHDEARPGFTKTGLFEHSYGGGGGGGRWANYKPLDWKCRCRDHLYNP